MHKEYSFLQGFLDATMSNELADLFELNSAMEDCSEILAELAENHHQPAFGDYYDLGKACGDYAVDQGNELPEIFGPELRSFMRAKFVESKPGYQPS